MDLLPEGVKLYLYLILGMSSFLAKASKGKRTAVTAPHHGAELPFLHVPKPCRGRGMGPTGTWVAVTLESRTRGHAAVGAAACTGTCPAFWAVRQQAGGKV